jgi:hypothetical protein
MRIQPAVGACLAVVSLCAASCGGRDTPSTPSSPSPPQAPTAPPPPPAVPSAVLKFTSDPGESVGNGQTVQVTLDSASITAVVGCDLSPDNQIEVLVRSPGQNWDLHLAAPPHGQLYVGTYPDARSWPVRIEMNNPGIAFYGNGKGCGGQVGTFTVTEAIFAPDGGVERFRATFEQRCVNFTAALRGEVSLVAVAKHSQPFLFCR